MPNRSLISARLVVNAKTAMISLEGFLLFSTYLDFYHAKEEKENKYYAKKNTHLATVMSNWVSLSNRLGNICMKRFVFLFFYAIIHLHEKIFLKNMQKNLGEPG